MTNKRLSVDLPPNWREASSELSIDIPTFIRTDSEDSGALQVSTAWYNSGAAPMPAAADLINFAKNIILNQGNVHDMEDGSVGECRIGQFGTVVAQIAENRVQVWCASNGYDFVLSTYTSPSHPDPVELHEAESIVRAMSIREGEQTKPWWKFW
jgi:hypothetical protein